MSREVRWFSIASEAPACLRRTHRRSLSSVLFVIEAVNSRGRHGSKDKCFCGRRIRERDEGARLGRSGSCERREGSEFAGASSRFDARRVIDGSNALEAQIKHCRFPTEDGPRTEERGVRGASMSVPGFCRLRSKPRVRAQTRFTEIDCEEQPETRTRDWF